MERRHYPSDLTDVQWQIVQKLVPPPNSVADQKTMTTHHMARAQFRQKFEPRVHLAAKARFYHDGKLWSSAGISAGIDMALRVVIAFWGDGVAKEVQAFLEYYPEPPFGP